MAKRTVETFLQRLNDLASEPAVREAQTAAAKAHQGFQDAHRASRDISDSIAEAELAAAKALLDGTGAHDGEDIEVLRRARVLKRQEVGILQRAHQMASDRLQETREAAKAALLQEYFPVHAALLREVEELVDQAAALNIQLRDLEYAAREVVGNQAPNGLHFQALLPQTSVSATKYSAWKEAIERHRKGQPK